MCRWGQGRGGGEDEDGGEGECGRGRFGVGGGGARCGGAPLGAVYTSSKASSPLRASRPLVAVCSTTVFSKSFCAKRKK